MDLPFTVEQFHEVSQISSLRCLANAEIIVVPLSEWPSSRSAPLLKLRQRWKSLHSVVSATIAVGDVEA